MNAKKMDLEKVIVGIVKGFSVAAQAKKQKLKLVKTNQAFPPALADSSRVAQVATNLVSNAIKYTPDGGTVTVDIKKLTAAQMKAIGQNTKTADIMYCENKPGYLVISVKDTGIGISEVDQGKLFSRFFRSKKVLQSQTEGTGLGLYITKSIVNLHQGDIWFTSELGKGSVFYFSLPIA